MMRLVSYLFLFSILVACSPLSKKKLTRRFETAEAVNKHHVGFVIVDPIRKKTIFEYQSDRYFTPASNTKILTLYAALTLLGDSVPAMRYVETGDSLIVWGTGDPSLLNKTCYSNDRVLKFLRETNRNIYFSQSNFQTAPFGPGWAWDDYNSNYSQERSSLPIYGNSFWVYPLPDQHLVIPAFFKKFYMVGEPKENVGVVRDISSNYFTLHPGTKRTFREFMIPFRTDPYLTADLLSDTLHRKVNVIKQRVPATAKTIYSIPADSLYKVMMQESDNHIAEQLLLICSGILSDTLKPEIAIQFMQRSYFNNLPDPPNWRDGSGLSRYNLFTPRFIAHVWEQIYGQVPQERLMPLLASGGSAGTIKNWYKAEKPYIYGKTGTLSNNHSLSGYLITRKGKTLIFAFMNANYTTPTNDIRTNMQSILNLFYENY